MDFRLGQLIEGKRRRTRGWTSADMLHTCADTMMARTQAAPRQIALEAGKPLAQSRRECQLCIDQFRWFAEEARHITVMITMQLPSHPANLLAKAAHLAFVQQDKRSDTLPTWAAETTSNDH